MKESGDNIIVDKIPMESNSTLDLQQDIEIQNSDENEKDNNENIENLENTEENLSKQQTSKVLASKGSEFIADKIINITEKQGRKGLRRNVKRRQYREIIKSRKQFINEDVKNLLAEQISSKLK